MLWYFKIFKSGAGIILGFVWVTLVVALFSKVFIEKSAGNFLSKESYIIA
jgi:hypothetical protein